MTTLADTIRPGSVRGLDFVSLEELRKRTGISAEILPFALNEMLANSLDKDAIEIKIDIQVDGEFDRLIIADNGTKKLSRFEIELIVNFENKASSKRGFLRVSRGYLGNALKCIFGYSYALAESRNLTPPKITIASGSQQYMLSLKPDRVAGMINTEIIESERNDDGYTAFMLKFPKGDTDATTNLRKMKNVILATSIVNPTRRISFDIYGVQGTLGTAEESNAIRQETSVEWYTLKQFTELFEDFLRASPDTQLKDFIAMFRGFTGRKTIREILQGPNVGNDDSQSTSEMQFFPTSTLKDMPDQYVRRLFAVIREKAKPIKKRSIPSVLGCVGEPNLQRVCQQNGWERLRYIALTGITNECPDQYQHTFTRGTCKNPDHAEFPYLIELAVFDRKKGDTDGLKVYSCVNFMASTEPIFARNFDVHYRLGRVGLKDETPVTIIVHLVCPVLKWLNYGKNALDDVDTGELLEKAFDRILPIPKAPREYHLPPPPRPLSWVPHGKLEDSAYLKRLKLFADEILAVESQRTNRMKFSSRGWCYVLEGLGKIDKGEFKACQKAINDCRKTGFLSIDFTAEDQDVTRRFRGIHVASDPTVRLRELKDGVEEMLRDLPAKTTDYWAGENVYVTMIVEKGDILTLFEPICNEYHVPIASSKGWSPINLRYHIANLCQTAEQRKLTPVILLFYDHDPGGLKITDNFRKNLADCQAGTDWSPELTLIRRFGLNADDIDKYGLTWIENLKSSSGREVHDDDYISQYGRRKCESNALLKSDETLRAAEEICRNAIERHYGKDARERFKQREEQAKGKLRDVYDNSIWTSFLQEIDDQIDSLRICATESRSTPVSEVEIDVFVDKRVYGRCPSCGCMFNYEESDFGKLKRCWRCGVAMRVKEILT